VESTVEKFAKTVRKKNTIFVVNMKSIVEEEKVVTKDVAKLLKEYKDVFLVKSPPDLLLEKDDDYTILTVPEVRLQARFSYRLTPEKRKD
jgi:hypothetical protein